jgi:hypothetical protein
MSELSELETLARQAASEFDKHCAAVETEAREAANAARTAAVQSYSAITARLREARDVADKRVREQIDATATHPWEGQRVKRATHYRDWKGAPMLDRPPKSVELGIVEIRRSATRLPGNRGHSLPKLGQAFVRLLKKDGTTGTAIADLEHWRGGKWELDTTTTPESQSL